MRVKHIKFNVVAPKIASTKELNWSLGMGPCGRWVESLEVDITLAVVTIKQTSYAKDGRAMLKELVDGMGDEVKRVNGGFHWVTSGEIIENSKTKEIKTFIYKLEDVRGRIEAIEQDTY